MVAQVEVLTRDQVPVEETWDLTKLYPTDADWESAATLAKALVATAAGHRGHLDESAARLRQALDDVMAAHQVVERLNVYASLRRDENTADTDALARYERAVAVAIEGGQALAFLQPEILAISEARLADFMADPSLATYRHMLDDINRRRPYTRSIEVEEILAQGAEVTRTARDAFAALDNADLTFGKVRDDEGREIELTKGRYMMLMESKDRNVRRLAYDTLIGAYDAHKHTISSIHGASVRKDVYQARVRHHNSARETALFDDNLPAAVYDSLIAATREARPAIERYLSLRQHILGVDPLEVYDLYVPLATLPERTYEYREAVGVVLDGLSLLGDDYVSMLGSGFDARWVDVRETKGKRSGAYSWGTYGAPPVILMNWNGTMDHVFTLAHEAGHAMHSHYSTNNQPYHDAHYSIFLAEVASTVNEVLLTWKLLDETSADDPGTRFSILNRFADTIYTTLVRQTMFAEFEQKTHELVESGQPLTLASLNDLYGLVVEAYCPGINVDEQAKLGWSRVPHFYRAFYVFQYATGISSAVAIARAIRDEGAPAAARYREMLRAGGSDYSLSILQRAGVDLTTPEPVREALREFDRTVEEMERLHATGSA
ncbi:MAG: oligoendopeptidase F [Thermomicrobiales bacterium]